MSDNGKSKCLLSLLGSKAVMWWQGHNSGSPRRTGFAELVLEAQTGEGKALFSGKFSVEGYNYFIERGVIEGDSFTFTTKSFRRGDDRAKLVGKGKCGPKGNLGTFRYAGGGPSHGYDFFIGAQDS